MNWSAFHVGQTSHYDEEPESDFDLGIVFCSPLCFLNTFSFFSAVCYALRRKISPRLFTIFTTSRRHELKRKLFSWNSGSRLLLLDSFMRARFAFGSFYKSKKTKIFYENNFLFLSQANFQLFGVQTLCWSSFDAFRCISNWSWMTINSPKLISKSSTRRSLKRIFWSLKPHRT